MKAILARGVMTSAAAALTFASATVLQATSPALARLFRTRCMPNGHRNIKTTNVGMNYQSIGSGRHQADQGQDCRFWCFRQTR